MFPSMFDHPFFTTSTDGESRAPSRALYRWERIKKAIANTDEQIECLKEHKKKLEEELKNHREEAKEFFKELLD